MQKALVFPAVLLGVSCSIHASRGPYPYRDPYGDNTQVRTLAYELEKATWSLHRDAEAAFRHGRRHERTALKEVRKLESRARHFRRRVERHGGDDRHSWRDFEKFLKQHERTERALSRAYAPRFVYRSLERVRHLVHRLEYAYGGYGRERYGYERR